MRKNVFIILSAVFLTLTSCGGGSPKDTQAQQHLPGVLSAVTSDALAVMSSRKASESLRLYDTTSVLHKLDLSRLRGVPAALSLCYNGALVPVLAIDAGKAAADSTSVFGELISHAEELNIHSRFFEADPVSGRHSFLVLTPSEAQLTAVKRHIDENRSILEANDFRKALAKADVAEDFIVIRNAGAARLLPKAYLENIFPRRSLTAFLSSAAEWTVLKPAGSNDFNISAVVEQTGAHFLDVLESLPFTESRLGEVLPDSCNFVLSLPIPQVEFRQAYERYVDAASKLTDYNKRLAALKSASGKDPLKWEKEIDIREVALVNVQEQPLMLVRSGIRKQPDTEVADNPYKGFLQALYGAAFNADDSCFATRGAWRIFGSDEAVRTFLELETSEELARKWPTRDCKLVVGQPGTQINWTKKSFRLCNTSL